MTESIRIAHLTDTHLGFRQFAKSDPETGRNQRTVDFEQALEWIVEDIIKSKPDAVLHAGDVFHHTRPTWQTLRHFVQQFRKLEIAGIPTLVIAGNHDTPRVRTGGSAFSLLDLALPDVRFVTEYDDAHVFDVFKHLDLHVHAIPHGALTNDDPVVPQTARGRRNILLTHGMAHGILPPGQSSEPAEQMLSGALLSKDFDYIALGHYHLTMQPPGIANAWYAGATERNGWGDKDATPGYMMVTLGDVGSGFSVEHIDYQNARPMTDLGTVFGDGRRGRDIADKAMEAISTINDPRTMARLSIRNAERSDRREAESILKLESGQFVWSLTIPAEQPLLDSSVVSVETQQEFPDLRQLFVQFVETRKGQTPDLTQSFATRFLERGDRALTEAMTSADAPAPEGDTLA